VTPLAATGRVALVSGGGRGIGRGISLALAEAGASVAINYRKDVEAAEKTAAEIVAAGGQARVYAASVDDYEQDQAMVDAVVADFGHLDILVNNAGIASRGNSVADTEPAELQRVLATHVLGAFYLSQLAVPHMRTRPRGDIVTISSMATSLLTAGSAPYNMAKAAQEALSVTLAKEEAVHGIRVNVIAAGLVDTDMGRRLAKAVKGVSDIHTLDDAFPYGRVCDPADIGAAVVFLVSEAGFQITGQRLGVDGGYVVL
jgi:NAD(P)-dependent dehydrogenase (short-subunit alcohol dehydrogenase family)